MFSSFVGFFLSLAGFTSSMEYNLLVLSFEFLTVKWRFDNHLLFLSQFTVLLCILKDTVFFGSGKLITPRNPGSPSRNPCFQSSGCNYFAWDEYLTRMIILLNVWRAITISSLT